MTMATDRDRYARTLDKRFQPVSYAILTGMPDALERCAAFVEARDRQAEPQLSYAFQNANGALSRAQQPFPDFRDSEDARFDPGQSTQNRLPGSCTLITTCEVVPAPIWLSHSHSVKSGGCPAMCKRTANGSISPRNFER